MKYKNKIAQADGRMAHEVVAQSRHWTADMYRVAVIWYKNYDSRWTEQQANFLHIPRVYDAVRGGWAEVAADPQEDKVKPKKRSSAEGV